MYVCPLSLAHIQGLSAHQACFPVCRAAYPALQSPGNYSPAKQKTGVGFGPSFTCLKPRAHEVTPTVNEESVRLLYETVLYGSVCVHVME